MTKRADKDTSIKAATPPIDAHGLLVSIYRDENHDIELRLAAAKAAIRFEKPALASVEQKTEVAFRTVVALPETSKSTDAWLAKYAGKD